MKRGSGSLVFLFGAIALLMTPPAPAQKPAWRQATDTELAAVLPSRAPVGGEHIETEMRTASGIVDDHGHFIVGVVLLTAGYSVEGKYSHYMIVQVPVRIGGVTVIPGDILIGEDHGVLVIPASIVDKVLERAMAHDEQEEFQRYLLLQGEPIYGVYPELNEANRKKFEEWKKQQK